MVLVCISLMTNNVEHHILCLFTIYISPLVKCLSNLLPMFLGIFVVVVELWKLFIYCRCNSSVRCMICRYFLPVCSLYFDINSVFHKSKFEMLIKSNLSIFSFIDHTFGVLANRSPPSPNIMKIFLSYSKSFISFHFHLIFV